MYKLIEESATSSQLSKRESANIALSQETLLSISKKRRRSELASQFAALSDDEQILATTQTPNTEHVSDHYIDFNSTEFDEDTHKLYTTQPHNDMHTPDKSNLHPPNDNDLPSDSEYYTDVRPRTREPYPLRESAQKSYTPYIIPSTTENENVDAGNMESSFSETEDVHIPSVRGRKLRKLK
jgi:hypothetical protein